MARPEDIETDVTLELDGSEITPAKFRRGVIAFVGLLEALTKSVCRDAAPVEWRMQVKGGSNLVGANATDDANPHHVREILQLMANGLEQFDIEGEVPPVYPDPAIKHVRDLSAITAKDPDDDTRVGVWVRKRRTEITPQISTAARKALRSGFDELGTVEGQLSVLSERGGVHFVIYDSVWKRAVNCSVPEALVEELMTLWRRRVAVHGMVRYRADGLPTSVDVDRIEALPSDDELPTHEDVCGILRERA